MIPRIYPSPSNPLFFHLRRIQGNGYIRRRSTVNGVIDADGSLEWIEVGAENGGTANHIDPDEILIYIA